MKEKCRIEMVKPEPGMVVEGLAVEIQTLFASGIGASFQALVFQQASDGELRLLTVLSTMQPLIHELQRRKLPQEFKVKYVERVVISAAGQSMWQVRSFLKPYELAAVSWVEIPQPKLKTPEIYRKRTP